MFFSEDAWFWLDTQNTARRIARQHVITPVMPCVLPPWPFSRMRLLPPLVAFRWVCVSLRALSFLQSQQYTRQGDMAMRSNTEQGWGAVGRLAGRG